MVQIHQSLRNRGESVGELHPHHVFKLVSGTSTGGLIALMLGKMGMTVEECITQYEVLSRVVFGKKHLRGRITLGLAPAKYSGKRLRNCIRTLLRDRQLSEDLSMRHEADKVAWYVRANFPRNISTMATSQDESLLANMSTNSAVICREHCSSSRYSKLKIAAVPICSLPCKENLICKVCDAARATSAVPTFFPVMSIGNRFFADGGLGHNNPSFATYFHYSANQRLKSTRLTTASTSSAPQFSPHGSLEILDCSRVRFTNIGTGAKVDEVETEKRNWLASLIPGIIRNGVFLKQTLTDIAVNSEHTADIMRQFQYLNPNIIQYERFNANHGVSNIKLDDYNALDKIRERTDLYLEEQETKDLLEQVASAIATDYLDTRPIHGPNLQLPELDIDNAHQPLKAPNPIPASSRSSGQSSHSNYSHSKYPESESHVLFPNSDNPQNGVPALLTEYPAESLRPPDGQGPSKNDAHDDSGIDLIGPDESLAAALP